MAAMEPGAPADVGLQRLSTPLDVGSDLLTRLWALGLSSRVLELPSTTPIIKLEEHGSAASKLADFYEIEEYAVGAGSFGTAVPARFKSTGQPCVVKAVNKIDAGNAYKVHLVDGGIYERFLHMTQQMPHPNVVHYLDLLEGAEYYYVVMEPLGGIDLFEHVIANPSITELRCREIMGQVLASLQHLHESVGIFHRDVKLDNFRFRSDSADSIVLLDFGFARFIDGPLGTSINGTLMYLAPEVAQIAAHPESADRLYSSAVDLWASGIILYVLLVGRPPFQDEEVWSLGVPNEERTKLLNRAFEVKQLSAVSAEALDLLTKLLTIAAEERITATAALAHPWFSLPAEPMQHVLALTSDSLRQAQTASRRSERLCGPQTGRMASAPIKTEDSFCSSNRSDFFMCTD